jgi:hypothetical protein
MEDPASENLIRPNGLLDPVKMSAYHTRAGTIRVRRGR